VEAKPKLFQKEGNPQKDRGSNSRKQRQNHFGRNEAPKRPGAEIHESEAKIVSEGMKLPKSKGLKFTEAKPKLFQKERIPQKARGSKPSFLQISVHKP
jgi:hypothetical protein